VVVKVLQEQQQLIDQLPGCLVEKDARLTELESNGQKAVELNTWPRQTRTAPLRKPPDQVIAKIYGGLSGLNSSLHLTTHPGPDWNQKPSNVS
jgi:hypothetical protein